MALRWGRRLRIELVLPVGVGVLPRGRPKGGGDMSVELRRVVRLVLIVYIVVKPQETAHNCDVDGFRGVVAGWPD